MRINDPEWVSGNIFIRPNLLTEAGDRIDGHRHNFDHTTIVFTGAVHVRTANEDGLVREETFTAPAHFLVRGGVEHTITALVDDTTLWCVYSHTTPQATISQVHDGWHEAYQ